MKRKCDLCGIEADDYWMHDYSYGTGTLWFCHKCYMNGEYEAMKSDMTRRSKVRKINDAKKRYR